jgi:hypothetical protein
MFVEATLKSGQMKTKPPAPVAELNGNAPPVTLPALNTANTPTNAEASLNREKSYKNRAFLFFP